MFRGGELRVRTRLQNSMTTLGDARTVGAAKVAGSVGGSFTIAVVGRCWSQSAQFDLESAIEIATMPGRQSPTSSIHFSNWFPLLGKFSRVTLNADHNCTDA